MEKYRVRPRWVNMLSRCEDEDNPQYHDYGGRGVYVCEEWREFSNFYKWVNENGIDKAKQLDRVNNDGPYSPGNCRFVSRSENARNKRSNRYITAFGETKLLVEWLVDPRCQVSQSTLSSRLARGWSEEEAVSYKNDETRKGKTPWNVSYWSAFGDNKEITEWLKDPRCKISRQSLWSRLNRGWDFERALITPPR